MRRKRAKRHQSTPKSRAIPKIAMLRKKECQILNFLSKIENQCMLLNYQIITANNIGNG